MIHLSKHKKYYKTNPKFIFILRNPIDRYESHFNWMKGLGLEKNNIDNNITNGCIFNLRNMGTIKILF